MYDCFNSLGFIQFVHEASRVTRSVNNNVLDLILCNNSIDVDIVEAEFQKEKYIP